MTEPNRLPRLYDEKEVGRLLKRATELQHDESSTPLAAGVSLGELEEIAREAGIDPRYLRRAAVELDVRGSASTVGSRLAGEELQLVLEAVVAGELPQDGFEGVVSIIQQSTLEHGQPSLLGRTLTWRAESANKTRTIQVVVSARDGETRIRVEERLHQLVGAVFGGGMGGVGTGLGVGLGVPLGMNVFGSVLLATLFPLSVLGFSYLAAKEVYRMMVARRRRVLGDLLARLEEEVRRAVASGQALEPPDGVPELPRG